MFCGAGELKLGPDDVAKIRLDPMSIRCLALLNERFLKILCNLGVPLGGQMALKWDTVFKVIFDRFPWGARNLGDGQIGRLSGGSVALNLRTSDHQTAEQQPAIQYTVLRKTAEL